MFKFKKGFTLIELLVVIAVVGVLAVSLLSAINPLEQIAKARDSGSRSEAKEFLDASERYYATFGCYPWDLTGGACPTGAPTQLTATAIGSMGASLTELVTKAEIKSQFQTRVASQTSTTAANNLVVSTDASNLVHVCFKPSSKTSLALATYNNDGTAASGPNNYLCVP